MPLLKTHMNVEIFVDEKGKFNCTLNGKKTESTSLRSLELLIEKAVVTEDQKLEGVIYDVSSTERVPRASIPEVRTHAILGIVKSRSKYDSRYQFKIPTQFGSTTVSMVMYKPDPEIAADVAALAQRVTHINQQIEQLYAPIQEDLKALKKRIEATAMRPEDFAK